MTKIMIAEDDTSLREIYSIRLTAEGYEVCSAGDGEEALSVAAQTRPDLILSDVMMPKISGFDMLDIIRSTPELAQTKIIMMTALSSDDQRQKGENLGADMYLVKSQVGIEDVVNAVHGVLGDGAGAAAAAPAATAAPAAAPVAAPAMAAPAAAPAAAAPAPAGFGAANPGFAAAVQAQGAPVPGENPTAGAFVQAPAMSQAQMTQAQAAQAQMAQAQMAQAQMAQAQMAAPAPVAPTAAPAAPAMGAVASATQQMGAPVPPAQ